MIEVKVATNKVPDGIYYEGFFVPLSYEKLADLIAHFRDSGDENTCYLKRSECKQMFDTLLPMTDY